MDPAVARRLWTLYEPYHAVTYFSERGDRRLDRGRRARVLAGLLRRPGRAPRPVPRRRSCRPPSTASPGDPSPGPSRRCGSGSPPPTRSRSGSRARSPPSTPPSGRCRPRRRPSPRSSAPWPRARRRTGRALFAANAALPWPGGRRPALWHAATLLREHRGDGHVAALVAADLDGCQANVLAVAAGPNTAERMQQVRGWTDDELGRRRRRARRAGLVDVDGTLTPAGAGAATPRSRTPPTGPPLRPWRRRRRRRGRPRRRPPHAGRRPPLATDLIPDPNPIGVPRPA